MTKRTIVSAIIKNKNEYLIVRRSPVKEFAPNQWEFVSGSIEEGESPEQTMLREIKEETGCTGSINIRLQNYSVTDEDGEWEVIPFIVTLDSLNITLSEEHTDFRWLNEQELASVTELQKDWEIIKSKIHS